MNGNRTRREQAILVCLALVFVLLPLLRGGRDAAALPIALGILALVLVFLSVEGRLVETGQALPWYRRSFVWLILFVGVAAAELFASIDRFATATGLLELLCLTGYFYLGSRMNPEKKLLSWMLVGSALMVSIIGLVRLAGDARFRIGSTFENANALGGFVLLPLFLAFALARSASTKSVRRAAGIIGGILLVTLLLTFSVTGIVSAFVGCVVWWILAGHPFPSHRSLRMGFFALLVLAAIVIGLRWIRLGSFSDAISLKDTLTVAAGQTSLRQRGHFLSETFTMFQTHPIVGSGYNTWGIIQPRYQQTPLEKPLYAHSWYAQTIAETGVIGLIALLGFLFMTIAAIRSSRKASPSSFALVLSAGLTAAAIHGGIDFAWNFLAVSLPIAFFAGMATARTSSDDETSEAFLQMTTHWERVASTLGVLLVFGAALCALALFYGRSLQTSAGQRLQTGDTETAKQWFRESLVFAPDPSVRRDYANLLFETAKTQQEKQSAQMVAEQASREDPYDARAHNLLGNIAIDRGDTSTAEKEFRKALDLDPMNNPSFALDLAFLLSQQNRWDELTSILTGYLDRYRSNRPYGFNTSLPQQLAEMNQFLGEAALHQKDAPAAKQYFQTALKEDPTFPLTADEQALITQ